MASIALKRPARNRCRSTIRQTLGHRMPRALARDHKVDASRRRAVPNDGRFALHIQILPRPPLSVGQAAQPGAEQHFGLFDTRRASFVHHRGGVFGQERTRPGHAPRCSRRSSTASSTTPSLTSVPYSGSCPARPAASLSASPVSARGERRLSRRCRPPAGTLA